MRSSLRRLHLLGALYLLILLGAAIASPKYFQRNGATIIVTSTNDNGNTEPGPLQDNGGPTFTHALLPNSAVINTADPNFIPPSGATVTPTATATVPLVTPCADAATLFFENF